MIVDLISAAQQQDWQRARDLLYQHWINECPRLYVPHPDHPWEGVLDEAAITASLFTPLAGALCADSSVSDSNLSPLNEQAGLDPESSKAGQICGHVFKSGELTYTCKDCATDSTCVMCHNCFNKSEHKSHRHRIHTSSGSGYCDCGDADAWNRGYACTDHAAAEGKEVVVPQSLPPVLDTRLRELFSVILQYCNSLVCWGDRDTMPPFLHIHDKKDTLSVAPPYLTVLYNDETHTYEAVIRCLEMFIHCNKEQAMLIATIVDREGRSSVKEGSKGDCERVKAEIQRRTSRELSRRTEKSGPLDVKVMEASLVAHQNHAIALMTWINQQLTVFPPLGDLVGDLLLSRPALPLPPSDDDMDGPERPDETLLVRFLKWDKKMWKAARGNLHQLLMKTVLMNFDQKVAFAKTFLDLYVCIYGEFIEDDHDLDVSIVSLSVQFLTVPSIARRLIAEDDAMYKVMKALMQHTEGYLKEKEGRPRKMFDFAQRSFPVVLKRAMHMMRDQVYMLNAVPQKEEHWSESLRENFVKGFRELVELLHGMQGMDEVKRQSMEHQVWELEWETAFNIQLRIQEILGLVVQWARTDISVHHDMLSICLDALKQHPVTSEGIGGATHQTIEVNGEKGVCGVFDVLNGAISIHQQLWRLTAALFAAPPHMLAFLEKDGVCHTEQEKEIAEKVKDMKQDLYENSLRVSVLCAQTTAQLWRRNGFSLVNQIHNYYSPLCRTEMFDKDLLMLQVGAAFQKPNNFLLHIVCRFRLVNWIATNFTLSASQAAAPFGKMEPEESSKIIVALAEDMLQLLIQICGERFRPGVGKCTLNDHVKREVVHMLCIGPHPFSQINKRMPSDPSLEKVSVHDVLSEVASFVQPASTSAGQFHLKDSFYSQYNPFFYHYSKSDLSQAELTQQRIRSKLDRKLMACPPPVPCEFEPLFQPVVELLRCSVMTKMCRGILEKTAKRNRFSSDRLLHRCLYLVGMGLQEQERDPTFEYIEEAEKQRILPLMEALSGQKEAAMHAELLWWTIQKYKEVERLSRSDVTSDPSVEGAGPAEAEGDGKAKRAAMAAKMRAQALSRMAKMQSSFLRGMEKDSPSGEGAGPTGGGVASILSSRADDDEDAVVMTSYTGFPVCLGANRSQIASVDPRKITCILCQEKETLNPEEGKKPFVCAAYVQRSMLFAQRGVSEPWPRHVGYVRGDFVPASLSVGVDASTCSHTMHYECYQGLCEALLNKERQRPRQQMMFNQKMVDPEMGEYLCPLCKRLSNTAMPVLPPLQLMKVPGFSSVRSSVEEDFDSWVSRVKELIEAPPTSCPAHKPTKSHSRKRSHSERSLLDLAKQADELSSMPLENALSTSVPSASSMSLLLGASASPSRSTSSQAAGEENPAEMEASNAELDANEANLLRQLGLEQLHGLMDADAVDAMAAVVAGRGGASASPSQEESRREKRELARNFSLPQSIAGLLRNVPGVAQLLRLAHKMISPSYERYGDMMRAFSKYLHKNRVRGAHPQDKTPKELFEDNMRGYLSALATWQSTAHVLRTTAAVLENERKPLFGALNTRQRDCLVALSRLCGSLSFSMQHIPEHLLLTLGALLSPPPPPTVPPMTFHPVPTSPRSPDFSTPHPNMLLHVPLSPPHPLSSPSSSSTAASPESSTSPLRVLSSPFMQLFLSAHKRSSHVAAVNLLHIDMLSLAISLAMSIGWSWHDDSQSLRGSAHLKERELLPDGSIDEQYCIRLCLVGHYFQVLASFDDVTVVSADTAPSVSSSDDVISPSFAARLRLLWSSARPLEPPLVDTARLAKLLRSATLLFLRPIALFYHTITGVVPPEALKDPSVDEFDPLCRYLGMPSQMEELLAGEILDKLFTMWSSAVPTANQPAFTTQLVRQPVSPNQLLQLPPEFSDVIQMAASFRCPTVPFEETATNVPTLCLVCGAILCSQSYCCQKTVGKETMGACRFHMMSCSGQMGAFLRIRDCSVVLMTTRQRGCFRPAPYVDEFGEADQGFRRGNPLRLNQALYQKIRSLWLSQGITEEVVNQYEIDHRNMQYDWAHF